MNRSQESFDAFKAATAAPAIVLSLALVPIVLVPFLVDLSPGWEAWIEASAWVIWALFAVEYVALFWLAPDRRVMVRTHLFELLLVALPLLRPLRAARAIRLLRGVAGLGVAFTAFRSVLGRKSFQSYLLVLGVVIAAGAALTFLAERQNADGTIKSFGDALWWAVVTCTTVGYGDHFPVTAEGRAVGLVLMILGVGLLSVVTANVAAFFVEQDSEGEISDLQGEIEAVHIKLDQLLLAAERSAGNLKE